MQTRLAEQNRHTSLSISEWLFRAGIFVWVILFMMGGWLNEVVQSMLTRFAGEFIDPSAEFIDPSAERTADFGNFACTGQQLRRI